MTEKRRLWQIILFAVLCALWIGFIFSNSFQNGTQSGQSSTSVLTRLNAWLASWNIPIRLSSFLVRKTAHFLEFTVLGLLLTKEATLLFSHLRLQAIIILNGFLVACCDEWIQSFQVGRSAQWSDVLIDTAGVLFGFAVLQLAIFFMRKHAKKKENREKAG
jgi:VanZ family protein